MAKEELLEFNATVVELLPNATFRVKLENDHEVIAILRAKCEKTAFACWREIKFW